MKRWSKVLLSALVSMIMIVNASVVAFAEGTVKLYISGDGLVYDFDRETYVSNGENVASDTSLEADNTSNATFVQWSLSNGDKIDDENPINLIRHQDISSITAVFASTSSDPGGGGGSSSSDSGGGSSSSDSGGGSSSSDSGEGSSSSGGGGESSSSSGSDSTSTSSSEPASNPDPEPQPQPEPQPEPQPQQEEPSEPPAPPVTIVSTSVGNALPTAGLGNAAVSTKTISLNLYEMTPAQYVNFFVAAIDSTPAGGETIIDLNIASCLSTKMVQSIAAKNDITIGIIYVENGVRKMIRIPAGADLSGLIDAKGFIGFTALANAFGVTELTE